MKAACRIKRVAERRDWEELFSQVEQPHLPQSWAYGEAVHATANWEFRHRPLDIGGWRPRRLVFERDGSPVAICQLLEKPLGGSRWAALADRGPLFLGPEPSEGVRRDVYSTLRRARRHFGLVLILVPPLLDQPQSAAFLTEIGFHPRSIPSHRSTRVDLSLSEDEMFKKLKSNWRNQLRAGMRTQAAITVSSSPEDVEWIIDRHIQNMREKGFTTPEPVFARALYNASPEDFLVCRAIVDGESLAGLVAFKFGQAADYYIGWVSESGRKRNVNNVLFWETALELRRRGCRSFDLGGMRAGSTEPFKKGLGGTEYQLIHNWLAF
jgi:hypothetical protein